MKFDSLISLLEYFDTEQKCIDYFTKIRFKNGESCPHCGSPKIYHFSDGRRYKCGTCRKQFTIRVGTIFEDSKLSLKKWFIAIYLIGCHKKGVSSHQLARDIGVTQKTAWFLLQRIRYAMQTNSFNSPLEGIVEIDEMYIGGKDKNRHNSKKSKKTSKKYHGKTPVVGIIERDGEIRMQKFDKINSHNIKNYILDNTEIDTIVMTDEAPFYKSIDVDRFHYSVNHSFGQYVVGDKYTNTIEGAFSHFKRGIKGIYHSISEKHTNLYTSMFCFRFNHRHLKNKFIVDRLLTKLIGSRLDYTLLKNGA